MTNQFDLTDDQREIQELARRFTADRITPFAGEWDEKRHYPVDVWKAAGELGFGAIYISEAEGGIGLGRLEAALIMEAMAYGCPATSAYISIHNMATWMIERFGGAEIKARFLPDLVSMEKIGSYCLTEPGSGSDAAALKTSARRDGDHYVLNGTKQFISGAGYNDVYVCMVRTGDEKSKGITAIVVEKDTPGLSFGAPERKLGWNASPTAQVIFDDCRVPVANVVGAEGEGFRIAMMGLDGGRLNIGACSLGGAQRCLDESIRYTKERHQFGQSVADFQNTQFTLADMATDLEAARALLYLAAAKVNDNAPDKSRFSAMAKRLATDNGSSIVDRALQLHGGYGYLQDYPIERFWRDLRVHSILEGTNQIMRMIVGRELSAAMNDIWTNATKQMTAALQSHAPKATRPYDPLALFQSMAAFGASLDPARVLALQVDAAQEWGSFWANVWNEPVAQPRDRRFKAEAWAQDPWFRALRDAYLLASDQMKRLVAEGEGDAPTKAMASFLLDGWLNAVAPTNFPTTNPQVIERTIQTGGANLVQGFANLLEDAMSGKGLVKRRTDPNAFVKGETIAATPGQVVFQTELFQLIQYAPTTETVAAEPLLYVPPLVNRFYLIDLVPRQSLIRWLVDQGRTVFVISWVNPTEAQRDKAVENYVLDGIVPAIEQVRARTGHAPDLFAFCLGGTLVAITLAWLAAQGRAEEAHSATLIGSMVDFADMRDWSAFVHEAHLNALDEHLERQGYIEATELQQLFAAMRANDLIWSSVVSHYLLDQPAPPSDLLYWFEDGARIPAGFLKSYNRELLFRNALAEPAGFEVGGVAIDLAAVEQPVLSIALKDDHVSAWTAVYDGAKLLRADFLLGGSGHNAGVINPPAANKHGYWTSDAAPATAPEWLAGAARNEGSWWPWWAQWLTRHGAGEQVPARTIEEGIEPAPGNYAKAA